MATCLRLSLDTRDRAGAFQLGKGDRARGVELSVFKTELFAGDGGLTEGDAAVVGGDLAVAENFEAFGVQGFEAALKQNRVLEAAAAEADAIELKFRTHTAADFRDDGDERAVKTRCDAGRRCVDLKLGDDLVNHGAQIDVGGGSGRDSEVVRVRRRAGPGIGCGFEHHGGLSFEGNTVAQADERSNGVEEPAGG